MSQAPELPAELRELQALAAAADQAVADSTAVPGTTEPGQAHAAAGPSEQAAELGALLTLLVFALSPVMPFLPQCYTPQVCQAIGLAFDAVALKYGWNLQGVMGPEVGLAVAAVPPTVGAVVMGRQYFAAKRAEAEAEAAKAKGLRLAVDNTGAKGGG